MHRSPRWPILVLLLATAQFTHGQYAGSPGGTEAMLADEGTRPANPIEEPRSEEDQAPLDYNEEELMLRLLLGIIFPFLILVALRLTRHGLIRWEIRWRAAALRWLGRIAERRGMGYIQAQSRRIVAVLQGTERLTVFGLAVLLLSLLWFALFPQTRALAVEFAAGIAKPFFDLIGRAVKGLFVILYSAAIIIAALWSNRRLSRRRHEKTMDGELVDTAFLLPSRLAIGMAALFLLFFPHDGAPRALAVGVALTALFATLIALRPIIEEAAKGLYLGLTFGLRRGRSIRIDGTRYLIRGLGLTHASLETGNRHLHMPYSMIMKGTLAEDDSERGRHEE